MNKKLIFVSIYKFNSMNIHLSILPVSYFNNKDLDFCTKLTSLSASLNLLNNFPSFHVLREWKVGKFHFLFTLIGI